MAVLRILHGGRVRYAADIAADPTSGTTRATGNYWSKGDVLALQTNGVAQYAQAVNGTIFGLAFETRPQLLDTGLLDDETIGSGKVTMILDPAVIETDQYASGLANWEENQSVYCNTSGKLANVDAGSATKLGMCMSTIQSDNTVKILWAPQY